MTTTTCGNCKHWRGADWGSDRTKQHPLPDSEGVGQCSRILMDGFDSKWLAAVVDGSDYYAALRCKSTFGCVLFEPKEASDE